MADSNLTGSVYNHRDGSVPVVQSYPIVSNTSTTATRFLRVIASTTKPVVLEVQIVVTTADGGSSPTLSVGSVGSGYTDIINAASTATAATGGTFLPAANAVGKYVFTADTDILYKQGGTPDGTGVSYIIAKVYTLNPSTDTGL